MWTSWIFMTTRTSPQLSYLQLWLSQVPHKIAHPLLPFMSCQYHQWKIIPPQLSENSQGGHWVKALRKVTVSWPRGSHAYSQVKYSTNARQYQADYNQGLQNSKCPSQTQPFCAGDVKQYEHRCSCPARAPATGEYSDNCTHLAVFNLRLQQSQCLPQCGHLTSPVVPPSSQKIPLVPKRTKITVVHDIC